MAPEEGVRLVSSRRAARAAVIQGLYQMTIGAVPGSEALADILERESYTPENIEFIQKTLRGVYVQRVFLDDKITKFLQPGWEMDRIAVTDKCVLRLAVFELLEIPDMPPNVTISEAVALAKRYGAPESGRFVNGLLGQLVKDTPKARWNPADHAPFVPDADPEPEEAEPEVLTVEEGTPEHEEMVKAGGWTVRGQQEGS